MRHFFRITLLMLLFNAYNANAADWYFDKNSIGGACSDTGPGTITQPFCSMFNKLWNLSWNGSQAGDTIWIRGGTYTNRLLWIKNTVLTNGTPSNPITIKTYPGETVVFDGENIYDSPIKLYGMVHDLHFVGPLVIKRYTGNALAMDNSAAVAENTNLAIDNLTVEDSASGVYFRWVNGLSIKNSVFRRLNGVIDNVIGVGVRGNGAGGKSDNVIIEDSQAYDINDGKGNDNGDADGFWTNSEVSNLVLRNLTAYRCSEDGIDTKAATVTMDNLVAHSNGATGIKMWGSDLATDTSPRTYSAKKLLTYNNSETGVKCSGRRGGVTTIIDNLTSWGNGQDNLKNVVTEEEVLDTCDLTLRNSVLGNSGLSGVLIEQPPSGGYARTNFDHVSIWGSKTLAITGCGTLASKWTDAQYAAGEYDTDVSSARACNTGYGYMQGTSANESSADPVFASEPDVFEWASIATAAITSNTLTLVTEGSYPWPSPVVGHYIEINDDDVMRQITGVGNSTTRTIEFSPAVSSSVCGRSTDCRGVRIVGWAEERLDFSLVPTQASTTLDSGKLIAGVHCPTAGATGNCVTWYGSAPDLGYKEWSPPGRRYSGIRLSSTP